MKFFPSFLSPMAIVFLVLVGINLSAQVVDKRSLLQQKPDVLESFFEESSPILGLSNISRSDFPEHFFAERIYPEQTFKPQVFNFGSHAAILFWYLETGDRDVLILPDVTTFSEQGELFMYQANETTSSHWKSTEKTSFSTPLGGKILLEWNGPVNEVEKVLNSVNKVRTYRFLETNSSRSTGFGASLDCHFNVQCPEGSPFIHIADGVARILVVVEEGIGYCSGALVNNTAEDYTPYLLTAFHCMDGFTPLYEMWRFDFFYASQNCEDPVTEPGFYSLSGAEFRSGHRDTDFLLLELTESIPAFFQLSFLGWDRREDYLPANTALVHHPAADIKKVSLYNEQLRVHNNLINWNNGTQTPRWSHYRQNLSSGTFEPGSSGSPLLSPEARIMGQLHGGVYGCQQFIAYSGILYYSWDLGDEPSGRLRDWLDPLNTGQLILDELELIPEFKEAQISGKIINPSDQLIPDVLVELNCGDSTFVIYSDENGEFIFDITFLEDIDCSIYFSKTDDVLNGVNVLDIVLIRRDILGIQSLSDWQNIAADLNEDGIVNVLDIVVLRRLILGIYDEIPGIDMWRFYADEEVVELRSGTELFLEVTGLKMGDLDYNAGL